MNKHTPNRWTVTREMTGVGNRQVWGIVTAETGEPVANCGTDGEVTARFIVHACGCHADLLAALEETRDFIMGGDSMESVEPWVRELITDAIDPAIAKAKGADHE